MLLAVITLLSAISYSALANVVAYEAFTQGGINTTATLQYLYRSPAYTYRGEWGGPGGSSSQLPWLNTTKQNTEFLSQWFATLASLTYSSADQFLDDGAYINPNITNASLANLPTDITDLFSVPAYRLTYDCHPSTPVNPGLIVMGAVEQVLNIDVSAFDPLNNTELSLYVGGIENGASAVLSADNGCYQFIAFYNGLISTSFYWGNFGSFNTSNSTSITSFGPLQHVAFKNTMEPLAGQTSLGTKSILSMWGVVCSINRQSGTVDLHRDGGSWTRSPGTFSNDKDTLPLFLYDLQLDPGYVSPIGSIPGLGGALASSSNISNVSNAEVGVGTTDYEDFTTWANNYLYAEGEARRIAYEIALEVPSPNPTDDADLVYEIQAHSGMLRYHITFVPWILVLGLLTLILAGLTVFSLAVTKSGVGEGRVVTPLRVVLDAGAGLKSQSFQGMERWGDEEVDQWGAKYMVRYARMNDEIGKSAVRLKQA